MNRFLITLFSILISVGLLSAQSYTPEEIAEIELLNKKIANKKNADSTIARAYVSLSEILYVANIDTLAPLCEIAKGIAEKNLKRNDITQSEKKVFLGIQSDALNNIGYIHKTKGNIPLALKYYHESLKIHLQIGDKTGIATSYNNIGFIYRSQGNVFLALEYFQRSLTIQEQLNDHEGMASLYNNIGIIYFDQMDFDNALKYYEKSLKNDKKVGYKKGIANTLSNIGLIYFKKGNNEKALSQYTESLKLKEELGDKQGIAISYNHIGELYESKDSLELARDYFEKSLTILEQQGDKKWIGFLLKDLSDLLLKLGEIKQAEIYAERSYKISQELGFPANISNAAQTLSKINKLKGNYREALEFFEQYSAMKDSLLNNDIIKNTKSQQLKYEFEKKQAIKDAEHQKDIELAGEKQHQQQMITYGILVVLLIVILLLAVIFNRLNITRKQKRVIEVQKLAVETAKVQLEEKNKEITDSINYAKRIQDAILKPEDHESQHLPQHFILFKPKDIVSGDFYWAIEKDNHLYIAAGDCTGHGVPGALLTMLGNSFLNEINAIEELLTPAVILNQLRAKIIKELNQKGAEGENHDGMDISLIRLNLITLEMHWAGANNPLYIISDNQLKEIKPDKQPVGFNFKMVDFTNHIFQMKKGEYISIFTDGFADQFGGPKGKKYKYNSLKNKLIEIYNLPLNQQKQILAKEFEQWKGSLQQVDDICVIGLKI
ncbi:MAG: tetratricopeptide repeat protein [Flavobacteriales bacterium]|nr:tetratricopeptide repeat protein [Flavobacteriales bacterium]